MNKPYTKPNQYIQNADLIGAFGCYVRRPLPQISGMCAQFFGPNGEDSDAICALSLTKYLDAEVFVTIYHIKDFNGALMKKQDGTYPQIAQFSAIVRRSSPARGGMLAQFFASNGEDADSINELGKTKYLDSLVYVEVRGAFAKQQRETLIAPTQTIEQDYLSKITEHEIKEYKRKEKAFKKLNMSLSLNGFLKTQEVLYKLANKEEYKNYLMQKGCCWPAAGASFCDQSPLELYQITSLTNGFNYLAFCEEHIEMVRKDISILPGGQNYLHMKQEICVQDWAMQEMRKKFSPAPGLEPDSAKIMQWAVKEGLDKYLPASFKSSLAINS